MAKPYVLTPADEAWIQNIVEQVNANPGGLIVLPDDTEEEE
jgi:hypothetical protein